MLDFPTFVGLWLHEALRSRRRAYVPLGNKRYVKNAVVLAVPLGETLQRYPLLNGNHKKPSPKLAKAFGGGAFTK